jgi:hypothetical protein
MRKEQKSKKAGKPAKKKGEIHIPLVPIPDDAEELEDEMRELFEEDQVTHKHGTTEPERD